MTVSSVHGLDAIAACFLMSHTVGCIAKSSVWQNVYLGLLHERAVCWCIPYVLFLRA